MRVLGGMLAALLLAGCAGDDVGRYAGGGGGGDPIYQADRRPDQVLARKFMAQALVDATRMNQAVFAGERGQAAVALGAVRDDLRLAASRAYVDQHSRIIALDGHAAALGAMIDGRTVGTPRAAGQLVRELVAYHDIYAWGLAEPTTPIGQGAPLEGGGGGSTAWPESTLGR